MKKLIVCIVSLWITTSLLAADYQYVTFRSTSIYVESSVANDKWQMANDQFRTCGSLSAISSANFQMLNSEGGACYQPSTIGPRKAGRPGGGGSGGGSGAIGEYDFHSPVGDIPFGLLTLLIIAYGVYGLIRTTQKRRR